MWILIKVVRQTQSNPARHKPMQPNKFLHLIFGGLSDFHVYFDFTRIFDNNWYLIITAFMLYDRLVNFFFFILDRKRKY